jgi:hypothetical protein
MILYILLIGGKRQTMNRNRHEEEKRRQKAAHGINNSLFAGILSQTDSDQFEYLNERTNGENSREVRGYGREE